jgi:hypothetical protein
MASTYNESPIDRAYHWKSHYVLRCRIGYSILFYYSIGLVDANDEEGQINQIAWSKMEFQHTFIDLLTVFLLKSWWIPPLTVPYKRVDESLVLCIVS